MRNQAVLLVHGIGDFAPGRALANVLRAVGRRWPDLADRAPQPAESIASGTVQRCDFSLRGRSIRLAEFHWSGAFGKLRGLNPFRTLWLMFGLFKALPELGAYGAGSPRQIRLARAGGLALWSAAALLTLSVAFVVIDVVVSRRQGVPVDPESLFWNLLFAAAVAPWLLLVISFIGYLRALDGQSRRSGLTAQWIGMIVGSLMLLPFFFVVLIVLVMMGALFAMPMSLSDLLLGGTIYLGLLSLVTLWILRVIDLMRDVVAYLASPRAGEDNRTAAEIKAGIAATLDALVRDGWDDITLVSHSLGSAIALEVLEEWVPQAQRPPSVALVTCGSPLLRWLHPLLPNRFPAPQAALHRLRATERLQFSGWLNLYRVLDPVGQRVFPKQDAREGAMSLAVDSPLRPRLRPPFGHANYWGDRRFLDEVVGSVLE